MTVQPTPPATPSTPPSIPPTLPPPPARRSQFVLWGAIAAVIVVVLIVIGLMVMRPNAASNQSPKPGTPVFAPPETMSTPTPGWTLLDSSTPVRPGIYVKIVRPAGMELFKAAGFDNEFIVTLPVEKIVYVVQGPARANSLSWIQVTDGTVTGWGVQDYVVAYGIKNAP